MAKYSHASSSSSSGAGVMPLLHDISDNVPDRADIMLALQDNDEESGASLAAWISSIFCLPCVAFFSCYSIESQEQAVILSFGRYAQTTKTPGVHWFNSMGRSIQRVSTKIVSTELHKTTVIDSNGNPLIISAIVAYQIVNAKRALLNVQDVDRFVITQAEAAIKQGLSRFPYESNDGSPCLKTEASHIGQQLCYVLQEKVTQAGVFVHSLQLANISYSPEIAASMLKRQQATAMVEARNTIVEGAVDIACHAVEKLESRGISMTTEAKVQIVTNLLTVICSESETHTTLPLIGNRLQ